MALAAKRSADTSISKRGKDRDGMAIVAVVWFHVSLVTVTGRVCGVYVAGRYEWGDLFATWGDVCGDFILLVPTVDHWYITMTRQRV